MPAQTPSFFLHASRKSMILKYLDLPDLLISEQNIANKGFKRKFFVFNELAPIWSPRENLEDAACCGKRASMLRFCAFCILGQGYPSQRQKKRAVEKFD